MNLHFRNSNLETLAGDARAEEILEIIQNNFIYQQVLEAVRGNNIILLVFSNIENLFANLEIGESLGNKNLSVIRF